MGRGEIERRIDMGRSVIPSDLVLRGGQVFDVVTGHMIEGDVAICGDTIVGIGDSYEGVKVLNVSGLTLVPGFIDTHLHIESSLVTPHEFDRCVTPRGITTVICDPHEIANVAGVDGIRYFLDAALETVLDIRVNLSSCVPSTAMETAGAEILSEELEALKSHPKVIGLAEFMNYPGVLFKDPECMKKLTAFAGMHIDGHAPLLSGRDLNGYLSAGIRTEHEATTVEEALEKLRKGMRILIREGSVSKDLEALHPILTPLTCAYVALCTDDRNPLDIAEHGHLDHMIRTMIAKGVEPVAVYRAASLSAAEAFGLKDRGQIAPGRQADLVGLGTLEACDAQMVLSKGRVVNDDLFRSRNPVSPVGRKSVKRNMVTAADLTARSSVTKTSVIGILPGKILTEHLTFDLPVEGGEKQADIDRDLIKIAVLERHGNNGNTAAGFVKGFGLKRGAIASTVCHDHHNIAVVGASDQDMALAANRLIAMEGGFVVTSDNEILAELALPVAGLMSLDPFEKVHEQLISLRTAARSLGVTLEEPFLQLAFLALPVIPSLKITDFGMVDVDAFQIIEA